MGVWVGVPRHSKEGAPLPSAVCKPDKVNRCVVVAAPVFELLAQSLFPVCFIVLII